MMIAALLSLAAVITAASPSQSDVTAAYNQCANGDTLKIPSGSASWATPFTADKWLVLQGAGSNSTVITFTYSNAGGELNNAGIVMQGQGYNQVYDLQFKGVGGYTARPALVIWSGNMRVSRCAFVECASAMRPCGPFGVVDHNTCQNCRGGFSTMGWGDGKYNWDHYYPIPFNSTNYLFFEDNSFEGDGTRLTALFGDNSFVMDSSGQGSSYVSRYNTALGYNNAQLAPVWDWHGDSGDGTRGNTSSQVYKNKIILRDTASVGYLVAARGGQSLIYSNDVTGPVAGSVGPITVWEEHPQGSMVEGQLIFDSVTNQWQWANTVNAAAMTYTGCAASPSGCGMLDYHNAQYTGGDYAQPYPHPLVTGGNKPPQTNPGSIRVIYAMTSVNEAYDSATVVLLRENGSANQATVSYKTVDGTAKAGINYTNTTGIVAWPNGDANNKSVDIPLRKQNFYGQKTFSFQIFNPTGGTILGSITNMVISIVGSVTNAPAPVSISVSKPVYTPTEPILVSFTNAPGNAKDWVALYKAGSASNAYLQWMYTDGTQTGTAGIASGTLSFTNGLAADSYEARIMFDDSLLQQASAPFAVQTAPPPITQQATITWSNLPPSGTITFNVGTGGVIVVNGPKLPPPAEDFVPFDWRRQPHPFPSEAQGQPDMTTTPRRMR
jgi:hypothetical protein